MHDPPDPTPPPGAPPEPPPDRDRTVISSTPPMGASEKTVATLVVVHGAEIGRYYPLRRSRVVLGRSETADIALPDRQVSRAHAAIEGVRLGNDVIYRLKDLGSTNHVYVNGEIADSRLLLDGDKVQVGDTVLKFELHDAIDARFHDEVRSRIAYDELTGLLTWESFRTAFEWELARWANRATGCAVLMMDLDDFKKVNDTHGHLLGSQMLREVGGLVRSRLRQFDVASRYGGEEFVAYLPETASAEAATAAERLRGVIAAHEFSRGGRVARVTISIGISHFPQDGERVEPLVDAADRRLYAAKRAGKDRVVAG